MVTQIYLNFEVREITNFANLITALTPWLTECFILSIFYSPFCTRLQKLIGKTTRTIVTDVSNRSAPSTMFWSMVNDAKSAYDVMVRISAKRSRYGYHVFNKTRRHV